MTIREGSTVTVVLSGERWVLSGTAATAGQKVFAVKADGSVKTGAAGATVTGAVETKWTVVRGGAAGEVIAISAWR